MAALQALKTTLSSTKGEHKSTPSISGHEFGEVKEAVIVLGPVIGKTTEVSQQKQILQRPITTLTLTLHSIPSITIPTSSITIYNTPIDVVCYYG
jgi:hypothetical protein